MNVSTYIHTWTNRRTSPNVRAVAGKVGVAIEGDVRGVSSEHGTYKKRGGSNAREAGFEEGGKVNSRWITERGRRVASATAPRDQ